ncbi:hypothetical protein ABVT39_025791 [Epinephelus coioides]
MKRILNCRGFAKQEQNVTKHREPNTILSLEATTLELEGVSNGKPYDHRTTPPKTHQPGRTEKPPPPKPAHQSNGYSRPPWSDQNQKPKFKGNHPFPNYRSDKFSPNQWENRPDRDRKESDRRKVQDTYLQDKQPLKQDPSEEETKKDNDSRVRLLLLMLLRLVVLPDNVCTSYNVFSGDAFTDYRNNWCLSLHAFFPHLLSKSGTFSWTAFTRDRSPKSGAVPGNRGCLVTVLQRHWDSSNLKQIATWEARQISSVRKKCPSYAKLAAKLLRMARREISNYCLYRERQPINISHLVNGFTVTVVEHHNNHSRFSTLTASNFDVVFTMPNVLFKSVKVNQHMPEFTQFAVEVRQQMADINARLISLEEHSRNCSSGEEPTRKKRREHNPKIAETVRRLHNIEGNNRRYEPEQGLSSPHNEAVTSHLVAAPTTSPDMDGVDRGVLLSACKTYYPSTYRLSGGTSGTVNQTLRSQAAAIKNSARNRQRRKRLLEARRSVLATTEEVDFWRGITIDMMSDEEDHSVDGEVGWIVRPPSFRSHKLSDLCGRLQERLEMNPKYVATHHKRLHIGSPSDRLAPTQYDPDAAKRHLMRPEA